MVSLEAGKMLMEVGANASSVQGISRLRPGQRWGLWEPAIKTANDCHYIPQAQLNKSLQVTKLSQTAARNTGRCRVTCSNQIIGRIIDIKTGGLVAQVSSCIGCQRITSIVASLEVGLPRRLNA